MQYYDEVLNGWEMSNKVKDCKIYKQSFPDANTNCMEDYKNFQREMNQIILSYIWVL